MMRLVFIADEFKLRTRVQQLLDRFLMGYPHDGSFHKPECEVVLVTPEKNGEIERRMKDFGLRWQSAEASGDAVLIFNPALAGRVRSPHQRSFTYGALPESDGALRGTDGIAGTAVRGRWLLPEISIANDVRLTKGVVIVQGEYPQAEVEALDA